MKTKQLQKNWKEVELGDILNYEQPTKYIVEDTNYNDNYDTPVLTAGKSFILGYTNEKEGIYNKLPVIIFDDFTTENKFVTFPFKVKSSAMKLLTPKNKEVDLKFIFLLMQTIKVNSETHKRYYLSKYQHFKIPLPPLTTQKAIVKILEKAESLKKLREQSDKLTNDYLKSVFNEMFLKKKGEFKEVELGDITKIVSGSTPSTTKPEYWNGEINWVTPAELINGHNYYYDETKRKISKEGLKSCSAELFPKGTVMLTTRAPIGKVAIAGREMCSNQGFKNFIPSERINSVYLYFWLLLKKDYLNSLGHGATFKEISKKIVSKIKIPLPPLPLQKKFASIVKQVEKLKEYQEQSNQEINNLFNALMQKAFRGEL